MPSRRGRPSGHHRSPGLRQDRARFEFQARSLAGLVLVPPAELRREFAVAIKAARKAGLPESTLWSEAGKSYVAKWLGDQFDVSGQVIEKRLEKDGLWMPPPAPGNNAR